MLLSRGVSKVVAVDVGYGQLAWELRNDPRVEVRERCNIRELTPNDLAAPPALVVADLSFISLRTVLPALVSCAAADADLLLMVKPQFEVDRGQVGKGGIVRDPELHREVCDRMERWLGQQHGWRVVGISPSPIEGADGNREFLLCGRKDQV